MSIKAFFNQMAEPAKLGSEMVRCQFNMERTAMALTDSSGPDLWSFRRIGAIDEARKAFSTKNQHRVFQTAVLLTEAWQAGRLKAEIYSKKLPDYKADLVEVPRGFYNTLGSAQFRIDRFGIFRKAVASAGFAMGKKSFRQERLAQKMPR